MILRLNKIHIQLEDFYIINLFFLKYLKIYLYVKVSFFKVYIKMYYGHLNKIYKIKLVNIIWKFMINKSMLRFKLVLILIQNQVLSFIEK